MQNHFTIAIDTCNHESWIEKCLNTCLTQKYENYEVILMDALSDDKTFEIAKSYEKEFKKLKIYQNKIRVPQVANFLQLVQLAQTNSIIVSVDGDDWLKNSQVLNKLNKIYSSNEVWMTYGTYEEYPFRSVSHIYKSYPDEIIEKNSFREYQWLASHLRTFKKELFLKINENDLKNDKGEWLATTGDQAIMFPMLELSGKKSKYISDILYVYNVANQSRDSALNEKNQILLSDYIRKKNKYKPIDFL